MVRCKSNRGVLDHGDQVGSIDLGDQADPDDQELAEGQPQVRVGGGMGCGPQMGLRSRLLVSFYC